jgi:hypothetical protein
MREDNTHYFGDCEFIETRINVYLKKDKVVAVTTG